MSRLLGDYEYMSLDDFEEALADKPRNERWELIGGRVVRMMVGARWEHAAIVQNVSFEIERQLRQQGSPCRTFTETFFLKEKALDAQLLPDVMVVCGDLERGATSTNEPVVLIEVLSIGTEARDRMEKWQIYRHFPTLQHYVLVSRDRIYVEIFSRSDAAWAGLKVLDDPNSTVELDAIGVGLPLTAIYHRVIGG